MRIAALVSGLLLAPLLVACGDEVSGDAASPSRTQTVAASPPALPSEAMANTSYAAIAFVKHWVAVLNYASQTGDVQAISPFASSMRQYQNSPGC